MIPRLQPVRVATSDRSEMGHLVFAGGDLVAVLVHLCEEYGDDAGKWYLEAGFGPVDYPTPPTFVDLEEAQSWIANRLAKRGPRAGETIR
jgi:hypothetical protein